MRCTVCAATIPNLCDWPGQFSADGSASRSSCNIRRSCQSLLYRWKTRRTLHFLGSLLFMFGRFARDPFNFIKSTTIPIALTLHTRPLAAIVYSRSQFFVRKLLPCSMRLKKREKKGKNSRAANTIPVAVFVGARELRSSVGNYPFARSQAFFRRRRNWCTIARSLRVRNDRVCRTKV